VWNPAEISSVWRSELDISLQNLPKSFLSGLQWLCAHLTGQKILRIQNKQGALQNAQIRPDGRDSCFAAGNLRHRLSVDPAGLCSHQLLLIQQVRVFQYNKRRLPK
jgi:hypothetical protein